ncbi:MAG: hypothetical protein ACLFM0_05270 [Spirochaetales bacterium]
MDGARAVVTATLFCLVSSFPLFSDGFLQVQYWSELEPFVTPEQGTAPFDRDNAVSRALDFSRRVFSGMLYGYDVEYTPAAPARGVERRHEVVPRLELPWGDPALSVIDSRRSENRIILNLRYDLDSEQARYRDAYTGAGIPRGEGAGQASILGGPEAKETALELAIVDAVHNHARSRYRSRPAHISARVLLKDPPRLTMREGDYYVRVRALVELSEVRRYELF